MPHPSNRLNKLRAVRHQTKVFSVTAKDQDGRAAKLGGASMFVTVRRSPSSAVLVAKTVGDGIEITEPDKGVAVVTLSTDDTASLEVGVHKYDVWVEFPGSPVVRQPLVKLADLEITDSVTAFP